MPYWGNSILRSRSLWRRRPPGSRHNSSSTSYQASGGNPADFNSASMVSKAWRWARLSAIQASTTGLDGLPIFLNSGFTIDLLAIACNSHMYAFACISDYGALVMADLTLVS